MKIYAISGLGADQRVFRYLDLDAELIPVHWIAPHSKEPMPVYAARLAAQIDPGEPFSLLAVSFGGLIAIELTKVRSPEWTILVSSVETCDELPRIYRYVGRSGLLDWIPAKLFIPPYRLACWLFGAKNTALLRQILEDTDPAFAKWAVGQLTRWDNREKSKCVVKIHGTRDWVVPVSADGKSVRIEGGGHFMIADRAAEISRIINEAMTFPPCLSAKNQ